MKQQRRVTGNESPLAGRERHDRRAAALAGDDCRDVESAQSNHAGETESDIGAAAA